MNRRGVSLKYAALRIKAGFPQSEDLPLTDLKHLPQERDTTVGAVDDARPDHWGERVIPLLDRPPQLSLLEYNWAGGQRLHALSAK